ncbi:hypothetical protein [Deinococcus murrayi]|uniref:hypothetical protein n=1 Tax=Deinococcus murrayi TaxID=68910 RepID=UPI000481EC20|nr:hypothetical protein [Deinococcus murrayi]
MHTSTPRPKTRTWATVRHVTAYGEHWGHETHTVTLTRDAAGRISAQLDGEPVPTAQAVAILNAADHVTLTAEAYLPVPPAPTIGKAAGCRLHKHMARAGIPSGEHYAFAARTLGRPVASLAALYPVEARQVWRDLCAYAPRLTA